MTFKIGYKASAEQFGPGMLADFAVQADALGFDSVMISDHFQPWRHEGGHAPSALMWLAAVAERTTRVQLGTSVLTPTLRYHRRSSPRRSPHSGCCTRDVRSSAWVPAKR